MMFWRLTGFAAALAALAAAVPAHAERLVVSLSAHRVLINSSFTGAEPVLFGVIERDAASATRRSGYDVVVTVTGPRQEVVTRQITLRGSCSSAGEYPEAIEHLKRATTTLPEGTPSWRSALWHLGVALEQSGSKEDALNYYITSYKAGPPDSIRRTIIEQLYRKINGSLDGLDERIGPAIPGNAPKATTAGEPTSNKPPATPEATATPSPDAASPAATPEKPTSTPSDTPKTDEAAAKPAETVEKSKPEATNVAEPTPSPTRPVSPPEGLSTSETALLAAASRLRSIVKISGQIRDANKAGIANVVVVLISPSGTVLASTTDSEGNYSFNVAPSQRTYRVIPSKDGYTFAPVDKAFAGLHEDQKDIEFIGTSNRSP